MSRLDALASNYRRALDRWPDASMLHRAYDGIRECFEGEGHGLVEHVKSFIESVCLTILGEFGMRLPTSTPSTTELLVAALRPLGLQNTRGANKLDKVLSGFNRLADALTEMRNEEGPVAHGKDGFLDAVCLDHARAFLHTGDAILGIILGALEGAEPDLFYTREPYERFSHLHERIDKVVSANAWLDEDSEQPTVILSFSVGDPDEVIEIRAEPSRLLYGIDRSAYIEILGGANSEDRSEQVQQVEEIVPPRFDEKIVSLEKDRIEFPQISDVDQYDGLLQELNDPLLVFLSSEGLHFQNDTESKALLGSLLSTLEKNLGLDWQDREAIQSRLKIASKRVLISHGIDNDIAADLATRVVTWFNIAGRGITEITRPPDVK